jgi:hypothetical protein
MSKKAPETKGSCREFERHFSVSSHVREANEGNRNPAGSSAVVQSIVWGCMTSSRGSPKKTDTMKWECSAVSERQCISKRLKWRDVNLLVPTRPHHRRQKALPSLSVCWVCVVFAPLGRRPSSVFVVCKVQGSRFKIRGPGVGIEP